jgi:hypothetical protein
MIKDSERAKVQFISKPKLFFYGLDLAGSAVYNYSRFISKSGDIMRGIPEPLKYTDHASNAGGSFVIGNVLTYGFARLASRFERSPRRVRAIAAGAGSLALLGVNALAETKVGVSIWRVPNNVVDSLDLVYGAVGGVLGSLMVGVKEPNNTSDLMGGEPVHDEGLTVPIFADENL